MIIGPWENIKLERTLKDSFAYRGIFENATEKIKLEKGWFKVELRFNETEFTDADMWIKININFNPLLASLKSLDAETFKTYAYENNIVSLHMSEAQHEKLTGKNNNYLLPIYKTIIAEALDYFFYM